MSLKLFRMKNKYAKAGMVVLLGRWRGRKSLFGSKFYIAMANLFSLVTI
jgi:hypothetical protein